MEGKPSKRVKVLLKFGFGPMRSHLFCKTRLRYESSAFKIVASVDHQREIVYNQKEKFWRISLYTTGRNCKGVCDDMLC